MPGGHSPPGTWPARVGGLWVHCEAGYRASVAASFLDADGRAVVPIDDDFDRAAGAGLPVVAAAPALRGRAGVSPD